MATKTRCCFQCGVKKCKSRCQSKKLCEFCEACPNFKSRENRNT